LTETEREQNLMIVYAVEGYARVLLSAEQFPAKQVGFLVSLKGLGWTVSRKRVERLMREQVLKARLRCQDQ